MAYWAGGKMMDSRLERRRALLRSPELGELVITRPLVPTGMVVKMLGTTSQAAVRIVGELGLREMTGDEVSGVGDNLEFRAFARESSLFQLIPDVAQFLR